jgi:tripartite-type tricarboxylate transporter receptor subunit TctC
VWQKTNYDAVTDFAPVTVIARELNLLAVHPSLPSKTVKELVALAKNRPGELNYAASLGSGRLATELFKSMAAVNLQYVPYKGAGPAIAALISGEVHLTINELGLMAPHVKAAKLRALAVTSATPSALMPGVPTVTASGVPGYEWVGTTHMMVPARTPAAIVHRLNQEIVRFLNRPEVKERFLAAGTEINWPSHSSQKWRKQPS